MLPTSPSADGAYSLPGSTPSSAQSVSASRGREQQQHDALEVADDRRARCR